MAKRKYLKEQQLELENLITTSQNNLWKKIGKISRGQERRREIPMEILLDNGTVCKDIDMVLERWKSSCENLLNPIGEVSCPNKVNHLVPIESNPELDMNASITREEVIKAMKAMKNNKSAGIDNLPVEVIKNNRLADLLTVLFKKCFDLGITPDIWKQSIVSLVPKSSTLDTRDPLQYRGISLVPVVYKIYSYILNCRLSSWEEEIRILHDAQKGLRKDRGTVDHLSTLTSIIEIQKLKRRSTFVAFIDFGKAYDAIDEQSYLVNYVTWVSGSKCIKLLNP